MATTISGTQCVNVNNGSTSVLYLFDSAPTGSFTNKLQTVNPITDTGNPNIKFNGVVFFDNPNVLAIQLTSATTIQLTSLTSPTHLSRITSGILGITLIDKVTLQEVLPPVDVPVNYVDDPTAP
jgi:hypothetical protein